MAHYIDKDALVAEIERLKAEALQKKSQCKRHGLEKIIHQIGAYNEVIYLIDTLEVKEVDLEEEIKEEYLKRRYYGGKDNMLIILNEPEFNTIAKHFFELGLKTQKGE